MAPSRKKHNTKTVIAPKATTENSPSVQIKAKVVEEIPAAVSQSILTIQILEWREKRKDFISEMSAIVEDCKRHYYPAERPRVT